MTAGSQNLPEQDILQKTASSNDGESSRIVSNYLAHTSSIEEPLSAILEVQKRNTLELQP